MLNLLSIWFRHGNIPEVAKVLMEDKDNINTINLDCWLGVVPQLIACMNHKHEGTRNALHNLLERLGRKHPQVRYVVMHAMRPPPFRFFFFSFRRPLPPPG